MIEQVLYCTPKGEPDWKEQILSTKPHQFKKAKEWAKKAGYNRFRVSTINLSKKPDFTKTINKNT